MSISKQKVDAGLKHLRSADPIMRQVIREVGPFTLRVSRDRFDMLARSIISQQISTAAARSILARVKQLLDSPKLTPERIAKFSPEQLRTAGLSSQKSRYLLDLCRHVVDGRLELSQIGRLSDENIIAELTQVKGIGRWTAQMFLIFALGRLDVFPYDDLGIRTAIRNLYQLDNLPDQAIGERVATPWRPYASIASWYCWRSIDLERTKRAKATRYPV